MEYLNLGRQFQAHALETLPCVAGVVACFDFVAEQAAYFDAGLAHGFVVLVAAQYWPEEASQEPLGVDKLVVAALDIVGNSVEVGRVASIGAGTMTIAVARVVDEYSPPDGVRCYGHAQNLLQ